MTLNIELATELIANRPAKPACEEPPFDAEENAAENFDAFGGGYVLPEQMCRFGMAGAEPV